MIIRTQFKHNSVYYRLCHIASPQPVLQPDDCHSKKARPASETNTPQRRDFQHLENTPIFLMAKSMGNPEDVSLRNRCGFWKKSPICFMGKSHGKN